MSGSSRLPMSRVKYRIALAGWERMLTTIAGIVYSVFSLVVAALLPTTIWLVGEESAGINRAGLVALACIAGLVAIWAVYWSLRYTYRALAGYRVSSPHRSVEASSELKRANPRSEWWNFWLYLGLALISASASYVEGFPPSQNILWLQPIGAFLFSVLAFVSLRIATSQPDADKANEIFDKGVMFIVQAPVALLLAILAGWVIFLTISWFFAIPSWAAVIIILLMLLVFRR